MDRIGGDGPSKKLEAAALHYWRGGGEFDQAREDLRQFGATEEQLEEQLGPEEKDCELWPENWEAWQAFMAVRTQWNVGMGGPTGLDYNRVRAGLAMGGITVTPEIFAKLRVIEGAILAALGKRSE